MREKEGYREQIERLAEIYPNKVALTVTETAKVLGIDKRTVLLLIKNKKLCATDISSGGKNRRYIVSISSIARMTSMNK